MVTRIRRLYYLILANLPERYYRKAHFFKSEKKMLIYASQKMSMSLQEIKTYYKQTTTLPEYVATDEDLPRRYQIKNANSILGLAFQEEILLNCYGLRQESDNVIKYVILHELGHANDKYNIEVGKRERYADRFALNWLG